MNMVGIMAAFATALMFAAPTSWAQTSDDKAKGHAELEKTLKDAKIPLERGLTASANEGTTATTSLK
jgi:hypothetical protein